MSKFTHHLVVCFALMSASVLMIGCGDPAGDSEGEGQRGTFTAEISGGALYATTGEAILRKNRDIAGSYHVRLGFNDPVENRFLLDIVEVDGIPTVGTHPIHTEIPMSADALNIEEAAFWVDGNFTEIFIADGQEIEITAASESRVAGNFSIDVEVQREDGPRWPAKLDVSFETLAE